MVLVGPADRDKLDWNMFSISAESFPADPG
jgi:hypothetical protein